MLDRVRISRNAISREGHGRPVRTKRDQRAVPNKSVSLYLIGIMFKDESAGTVRDFLDSIEQGKKVELPATANWRFRDVQFNLTTPSEKVLEFPAQFTIRDISKSGVIIQTGQHLNLDCMILLELSLDAAAPSASWEGSFPAERRGIGARKAMPSAWSSRT